MALEIEITEQSFPFEKMYEGFLHFKRKHKLTVKDLRCLVEAYRRRMMFHSDKPIEKFWLGLGTPSQYKSKLFTPLGGKINPRANNWFLLNKEGVHIFLKLIQEFPFPPHEKQQELNSYLFTIKL